MTTRRLDLEIPQGGTFRLVIDVDGGPANLTGYTGHMQIRDRQESTGTLADYTSQITVNPNTGQIVLEVPDETTALYTWDRGVYDLVIDGPLGQWRVLQGRVVINHSVTRP